MPGGAIPLPDDAIHTIEHNDGQWCPRCGSFAIRPDPRHTAHIQTKRPSRTSSFGTCPNQATKVVYRMATEEEQEAGRVDTTRGTSIPMIVETNVCDDHLEEAQKIYPHLANKEP